MPNLKNMVEFILFFRIGNAPRIDIDSTIGWMVWLKRLVEWLTRMNSPNEQLNAQLKRTTQTNWDHCLNGLFNYTHLICRLCGRYLIVCGPTKFISWCDSYKINVCFLLHYFYFWFCARKLWSSPRVPNYVIEKPGWTDKKRVSDISLKKKTILYGCFVRYFHRLG